jgi:hypothetical protein
LSGLGGGTHAARLDILKTDTIWATNTITHPDRIVPLRSSLAVKVERWEYVLPAHSIQVLEIDLK